MLNFGFVVPGGGAGFSIDPWMSGLVSLWQPSHVQGEGAAACPCQPHIELPPAPYAGPPEPRCKPGARMWTPLRPPACASWSLRGCSPCDQEASGCRWLHATATECLRGCVCWMCLICHRLQVQRGKKTGYRIGIDTSYFIEQTADVTWWAGNMAPTPPSGL